jgi:hypothetical protein
VKQGATTRGRAIALIRHSPRFRVIGVAPISNADFDCECVSKRHCRAP